MYRKAYPTWMVAGMDVLAAGILVASFRDAWSVVSSLGEDAGSLANNFVAAAVVLAIDASILLLEQARSQLKLRGGNTRHSDLWVIVLISISAMLNVRYLTSTGPLLDRVIGAILGVAIPSTIAVLGYLKGDMLAYNAQCRDRESEDHRPPATRSAAPSTGAVHASEESSAPLFRLTRLAG
jgi:hypothetical protein